LSAQWTTGPTARGTVSENFAPRGRTRLRDDMQIKRCQKVGCGRSWLQKSPGIESNIHLRTTRAPLSESRRPYGEPSCALYGRSGELWRDCH
jgi:hypothetical protein